jgi:hypothetical protein
MTTRETALAEIANVEEAAKRLAIATNRETQLEDERTLIKDGGIKRLMEAKTFGSVTAAEKGIEFDTEYMAHRRRQREAVADRIEATGEFEAAKLRARLYVEMAAVDALQLETV